MNSNKNHIVWSIYTKDWEEIRTLSWSKYTEGIQQLLADTSKQDRIMFKINTGTMRIDSFHILEPSEIKGEKSQGHGTK